LVSRQAPRPGLMVSLLADATDRAEGNPGVTASLLASGGESNALWLEPALILVAMTLEVVSHLHLHLHASPDSTSRVETVHPRGLGHQLHQVIRSGTELTMPLCV